MLLRSLPPPARSDGVPVLLPATHFREADANTLVSLLVQLTPQVSQWYARHPAVAAALAAAEPGADPSAGGDGVHIAHTATLAGLPHGYRLYLSTTSHGVVLITGHPSGRYFESPAEFVQHLLWLFDAQVQARACDCRLCQQQAQQQQAQQQQQQQQAQQQPHPGQMAAVHTAKPAQMTLAQSAHSPFAPSPFQPQWFREDPMASMNVAAAHMNMMSMALQMGSAHSPGGQRLLEQQEQELQLHSDDAGSQHAGGAADKEGPMDPVTEERFKRRYAMLRQEFEKVEKQIGKFDRAIATARKKMDRLKFERQVLLQMFVAHDAQQRGSDQGSSDDDSSVEENPSKKAAHSRTVSGQDSEANHANDSGDGEEDDEGGDDGRDGEEDGADVGGGGYDDEDEGEDDDTGTASTTPKRKRNPRKRPKVVDPNAPKRPANAFMLFCDMQRENLKEERKELQKSQTSGEQEASTSNLTKMLGHRWRSLSEAERQHYHDLFREQVKQYDRDLSEYFRSNPNAVYADMVESTSLLPDMSDDPNAPKKPANVFFVFCEMEREQLKEQRRKLKEALPGSEEEAGLSNITKALGQKWRSLSDAERQVYQDRFRQQLETYTQYVEQKLLSMPLEAVAKVAAKRAGGAGIGLANHGGAAALRAADDGLPASELHSEAAISLEEFGVDLDDEPAAPVAAVAVAAAAAVRHGSNGAAAPAPAVGVAGAGAVSVVDTDAMEEDPDDVDLGDLDVDDLDEDDEDDEGGDGESSEE
nr:hypothetical protein HK105_007284 [Polyrhizophydium stewartii]